MRSGEKQILPDTGAVRTLLTDLFDLWYDDVIHGRFIYIRYFENLLGMLLGMAPESCGVSGVCSCQYVVEADGSVYPCDFYMLDEYKLGTLTMDSFDQLKQRRQELRFIENSAVWPEQCGTCRWAERVPQRLPPRPPIGGGWDGWPKLFLLRLSGLFLPCHAAPGAVVQGDRP